MRHKTRAPRLRSRPGTATTSPGRANRDADRDHRAHRRASSGPRRRVPSTGARPDTRSCAGPARSSGGTGCFREEPAPASRPRISQRLREASSPSSRMVASTRSGFDDAGPALSQTRRRPPGNGIDPRRPAFVRRERRYRVAVADRDLPQRDGLLLGREMVESAPCVDEFATRAVTRVDPQLQGPIADAMDLIALRRGGRQGTGLEAADHHEECREGS